MMLTETWSASLYTVQAAMQTTDAVYLHGIGIPELHSPEVCLKREPLWLHVCWVCCHQGIQDWLDILILLPYMLQISIQTLLYQN